MHDIGPPPGDRDSASSAPSANSLAKSNCPSACGRPDCCRMSAFHALDGRGRLVGDGFRCWLAGYQTGDIAPWEIAMSEYEDKLGADHARVAIGDLGFWCRAMWMCRARNIEVFPPPCRIFCRDECLAIGMIGALQYQRADLARRIASTLLGRSHAPDAVIDMAALFAATLDRMGIILPRKVALYAPIPVETLPVAASS